MKTVITTNTEVQLIENKKLSTFLAILSFTLLIALIATKIDFSNLNPFQNKPETNSIAPVFNPNASLAVSDVVTKALTFKALLTTTQQATLQQTFTTALSKKWSNLPCGSGCRNGIQFSTLTAAQLTAALEVIAAATGTSSNAGYDQFTQILKADAYLGANGGGSGYSAGTYFLAYLNTPSTSGAWMLQFGGHHYAFNIAFNGGQVVGTTPQMIGVEPTSFVTSGTTYTPMTIEHDAMTAMLASLTSSQLTSAKLTTTFSDCLMSPGETNGNTNTMPSTKQGLICSGFSSTQKNLVLSAIQQWTNDMDSTTAATLLSIYTNEIDNTYIAWTGSGTSGTATTFLNTNTNYVRIDGPSVWIEFVCQSGVVFSSQIHYHSVWRDHIRDYGANLTNTSLLANNSFTGSISLKSYPNPTADFVNLTFPNELQNVTITIYDMMGKKVLTSAKNNGLTAKIDVSSLSNGNYILKGEDQNQKSFSSKFIKK
ncbi:DUF3500 domain-containing protein [Flavobacterium sp.]|uniref:DUF3500 domain-containing protein n=1 Tax=Flavobacterium sp. TaxID=239 RepID=UPI00374FF923